MPCTRCEGTGRGGRCQCSRTRRHGPGPDAYSPIRIATAKAPTPVTAGETRRLVDACSSLRDRFLIVLLSETGLRIGEALGLRHEDLRLRAGELRVVPRECNVSAARVKGLKARSVPAGTEVFDAVPATHTPLGWSRSPSCSLVSRVRLTWCHLLCSAICSQWAMSSSVRRIWGCPDGWIRRRSVSICFNALTAPTASPALPRMRASS